MKLNIELQPKQRQLYNLMEHSDATDIGWGGARGGGKSHGARNVMLLRRLERNGTRGLIFRRTYGELLENHIDPLFKQFPALRQYYNVSNKILSLPNRSDIVFGHAEHEGDITAYQGKQYMDILVDEATHTKQGELNMLRTCRRWAGVGDKECKLVLTCNPGGVGHTYIKRIMIDRLYEPGEIPGAYAFIPAAGWDNVTWAMAALGEDGLTPDDYYRWTDERRYHYFIERTQYGRDLNSLPEPFRSQHLLGRWDVFEGQAFPELGPKHDLDQWARTWPEGTYRTWLSGLKLIAGIDHATTGITASVVCGYDTDDNIYALREYYRANRLISEHAPGILAMWAEMGQLEYSLIDPSTEARTQQGPYELFSYLDEYRRHGINAIPAKRSSIEIGIDVLRQFLSTAPIHVHPFTGEKGSPRLFISRRGCPNLWKEMSELQCDNTEGRIEYIGADHATDCLRYVAMSRPAPPVKVNDDIDRLPPHERHAIKSHMKWAKAFDREITGGNNWWYQGQ